MAKRPTGDIDHRVNALSEIRLSDETLDSVFGHIARLGIDALEGWDAAAASLVVEHKVASFGITDDRVRPIDRSQYEADRGPCVDALRTGEFQYFDGTDVDPRWRQFAEAAGEAGIYSVMSYPLRLDDVTFGALNFYSEQRDAQRPGQREDGWVFASHAAVTISNVKEIESRGAQVEQLKEGLQTRTVIGQATGLLMAEEGLTSDEAFQKLVNVSQNANVKLREIAQRYVHVWEERKGATA